MPFDGTGKEPPLILWGMGAFDKVILKTGRVDGEERSNEVANDNRPLVSAEAAAKDQLTVAHFELPRPFQRASRIQDTD